jgi:D-alanine-D-alanine ligase
MNLDGNISLNQDLNYPLIVKPANTNHSLGITNQSVVLNKKQLYDQLEYIIKEMRNPAVVEEYIPGDEYEVFILGNSEDDLQVLPLAKTSFDNLPHNFWHIYSYEAKWLGNNFNQQISYHLPPKNISKKLESLLTEIALDTYSIFNCKDYAKVGLKIDAEGNPYVIDLNPNCWIFRNQDQGFIKAAQLTGLNEIQLLNTIIQLAINRYKKNVIQQFFS